MGFQTKVNIFPSKGVAGALYTLDGLVCTANNYLSNGTAEAGCFAFEDATNRTTCTKVAQAGAACLGIVVRVLNTTVNAPVINSSNVYPKGEGVTIAQNGIVYYQMPADASGVKAGQHALCDPANGKVTFGDAGAANDTGWEVVLDFEHEGETAKEGDLVLLQKVAK